MKKWIIFLLLVAISACQPQINLKIKENVEKNLSEYIIDSTDPYKFQAELGNYYNGKILDIEVLEYSNFVKNYDHPTQLMACAFINEVHPHYIFPKLESQWILLIP